MKFVIRNGLFSSRQHPLLKSRALIQAEIREAAAEVGVQLTPDEMQTIVSCVRSEMGCYLRKSSIQIEL